MRVHRGSRLVVHDAITIWQAVLGELQLCVPKPSYDTWLQGTSGGSFVNGRFTVSTPNAFVSEMLERRMHSVISQAVEKVVGEGVEITFQAGSGARETENRPQPSAGQPNEHAPARRLAPLNTRYTFDHFVVGKSNELAHAAALAVAEKPGRRYNPLFIYSGVGLGKTHLMHAIGARLAASGVQPIYATTEDFTNEYIHSIRNGTTDAFRDRYRSADALLLDDIQFIIGKEQTQEGFFHTFNALHLAGKQIVITSDRPASALTLLEDRIRSRLAGGIVVDIQLPDYETRLAILRAKSEEPQPTFPEEVLQFLAEGVQSNIRELEGYLNRLVAYGELSGQAVSLEMVRQIMSDSHLPGRPKAVSSSDVLSAVAGYFALTEEAITGRRRDKQTAMARHVTMYLLREEANMTSTAIGRLLGGKDHSTVLHACNRISSQMDVEPHLRQDLFNIRASLDAA